MRVVLAPAAHTHTPGYAKALLDSPKACECGRKRAQDTRVARDRSWTDTAVASG